MIKKLISFPLVLCAVLASYSQGTKIVGKVTDGKDEGITSAKVVIDITKNQAAITDYEGNYELSIPAGTYSVVFSAPEMEDQTIEVTLADGEAKKLDVKLLVKKALKDRITSLDEMVVTGSKFATPLSQQTVTLEVMKADMLKNNNLNSLDAGMNRMPGVTVVDGQANIRGGAGWSYGAGSRVSILYDGMPIMSADAADAKWSAIPVENIEQVEVIKGAASSLYGSSALNGIINALSAVPTNQPYTRIQVSGGAYEGPSASSPLGGSWDSKTHAFGNINFADRRKIKQLDLVTGFAVDGNKGYLDSSETNFIRGNIKLRYRSKSVEGLNFGVNITGYHSWGKTFFLWRGIDSLGYKPLPNSTSVYRTYRYTIDPFLNYSDAKDNRYTLKGRIFSSPNYNNTGQGSIPTKYYGEFQYSKLFRKIDMSLVTGVTGTFDQVKSPAGSGSLFGNKKGYSAAVYAQLEKQFFKKRLNVTVGARWEYFQIEKDNSLKDLPYPVFRAGLNYKAAEATYLRASFGQGFRYPTIAEKFIRTSVGAIGIYPNPKVTPEFGYSAEIGIKQGLQLGKNFKGFVDAAVFYNGYRNMMEFTFGQFGPQSAWTDFGQLFGLGFSSQNIGNVRIIGTEITGAIQGKAGNTDMTFIFGYTFIDPRVEKNTWNKDSLQLYNVDGIKTSSNGNTDTSIQNGQSYQATSTSANNILKYRNKHTVRLDYTVGYKWIEFNANMQYNSYVENIDYAFTGDLFQAFEPSFGAQSFSGLAEYRRRQSFKKIKGDIILNATISWNVTEKMKIGFLVKNLLNWQYTPRPAYYGEPRNYTVQMSYQF